MVRRTRLNPLATRAEAQPATDVSAADPQFGSTRDLVQIMNAVAHVIAAGGGTVRVMREDGPWSIGRRVVGQQKEGGILIEDPNVTLYSDGAVLNLTSNCDFIRIRSTFGAQVTITADTLISDTTLEVTSSATFTVGQRVFLRLGQAAYDAAEPDFWLHAKVSAVPDGTHITLDRPVGYALSVAATPTVSQRSAAPVTKMAENIRIAGTWNLVNPMTGGANAESGISIQHGRNITIDSVSGTDPGAGVVIAQFVDNLTIGTVICPQSSKQNGQASKGRVLGIAECRGVSIGIIEADAFQGPALAIEARCEGVSIKQLILRNTHTGRDNAGSALISGLGNSRPQIDSLHMTGNGSYVYDTGGSNGNAASIDEAYFYTGTRPILATLGIINRRVYVDGLLFQTRNVWRKAIPLTPSMSAVVVTLPAGQIARARLLATTLTGVSSIRLGSTAAVSPNLVTDMTAGVTSNPSQGSGFGAGYNVSNDTGKRVVITTDGTVPADAYLIVDVDYFADPAAAGDDDLRSMLGI